MNGTQPALDRKGLTGLCAALVLVSAFLLFQVQPVMSKMILPWFGGSPAVWTTCMLFFQVFLLMGYLYAHLVVRLFSTRWQGILHLLLLVTALLLLPIEPAESWKPADSEHPQWRILILLMANVGLPYLLLATSAPLVQSWYSRSFEGRSPYRFYALSNLGSLAALLSYPFWVEPSYDTTAQSTLWSSGFVAYVLLCGILAVAMIRWDPPAVAPCLTDDRKRTTGRPTLAHILLWLLLPAFASLGLLAVTNHICQDVAVVPFFWVIPLSLYLITFILCFDSDLWYRRTLFAVGSLAIVIVIMSIVFGDNVQPLLDRYKWALEPLGLYGEIPDILDSVKFESTLYLLALFCIAMLCHGELAQSRPAPSHLTLFYLCIAAGGALGGVFVAVIGPLVFDRYLEAGLFLIGGGALSICVLLQSWLRRERRWRYWWLAVFSLPLVAIRQLVRRVRSGREATSGLTSVTTVMTFKMIRRGRRWYTLWSVCVPFLLIAVFVFVWYSAEWPQEQELATRRNFYGVLSIEEYDLGTEDQRRNLYNGRILHGIQLTDPLRLSEPTTYYNFDSGIGLTLTTLANIHPLRVATVGLGTGTIASYGKQGDFYCFYEINPDVIEIAHEYFTFLNDSPAQIDVIEGDARLSMERQQPQHFDVIALDAFSGDAIPTHLLTVEAVATYLTHMKSDGVLAIHTSNRHLNLKPIVALLAQHYEMQVVAIDVEEEPGIADSTSEWLLMTRDSKFLDAPEIADVSLAVDLPGPEIRVWTDRYSNLFQIMDNWDEDEDDWYYSDFDEFEAEFGSDFEAEDES